MIKDHKIPSFDNDLPLCGIDEAGRGPLAGSLVIAAVVLLSKIDGIDDSKKLTAKKREELYQLILNNSKYHIVKFNAQEIDEMGISRCLNIGLKQIKELFGDSVNYLYDGNSTFGVSGVETLVKADAKVTEVAAASILAKVSRDKEMEEMDRIYPEYGFAKHKGYGTKLHIEAIIKNGRSPIHRQTFRIKQIDEPSLFG